MNYIKGSIVASNEEFIIVCTSCGVGYRLETFGLKHNEYYCDFRIGKDVLFFVEETFNPQSGVTKRYAISDYQALTLLHFLSKNIKKIPVKVLVSLVNQFNIDDIEAIIVDHNVKLLTSNIVGLGKANAEKICAINLSSMKPNINKKVEEDVKLIKNKINALGRKITHDESCQISKRLSEGKKSDDIFKEFIKNNGIN